MTNKIRRGFSSRFRGWRKIIFGATMLALAGVLVLDILLPQQLLQPLDYLYLVFGLFLIFFGILPLFTHKRLVRYYWERVKKHHLAVAGLFIIILLIGIAIAGPFFTTDPTKANFREKNVPPVGFSVQQSLYDTATAKFITTEIKGTWQHPLGTDDKGRDMLAMIVSGARVSLQVGLLATLIAIIIGTILGVSSAYLGGWVDNILMRFTDIMMTFPFFLLLVFIVFIYGPSLLFIILAIGLTGWTGTARLVRSDALSLRTRDYITAAKSLGASDGRIVFRHLIPNVLSPVIVITTLSIPGVILSEAALSFIGLGDPSVTSWGVILQAGQRSLDNAWWVALEPGIMLFLTVLAFNFLGDGIRDAFDPRSQL
ncbi:MAG: ABC transporter permease [Dehalococcoidales bacterium]|nr:ABC transporter permease [Dehalococcoidales bacterium]